MMCELFQQGSVLCEMTANNDTLNGTGLGPIKGLVKERREQGRVGDNADG